MFDFLIRKQAIKAAQKFIDRLDPKAAVHVPEDIPLPSVKVLKEMCVAVSQINRFEADMSRLSDDQLRAKTEEFRRRYAEAIAAEKKGLDDLRARLYQASSHEEKDELGLQLESVREIFVKAKNKVLGQILPEAFAVAREAGRRVLNMRHFDVQLIGGMVLHGGDIAEMTTGEGKTLVATLPAYLNALTGEGVHIVTVNDYLAGRDRAWMGPIYEFLGLTVGVIQHDMDPASRREAYRRDVTYGTNNEFGFDYLRDNMVIDKDDMVQRGHHFAVVDEVDSILVDEARTPLIISGPAEESTDKYYRAYEIIKHLKGRRVTEKDEIDAKYKEVDLTAGFDYLADEKARSISLTEPGEEKAAKMFGVANMHEMDTIEYRHHILQALKAKEFFAVDVDYVVRDGEVVIVDEFTGRLMPGRRWSDGLHQAVEAKEGIKIERENQTLATVTFQNYFRMYEKLSGMTGTAYTEANEFKEIYDLDCIVVPTNKKLQRENYADCIYKSLREKFNAVVQEIEACHQKGQPVLVGTISIEKSEMLSKMLKQKGIPHQVLNAKFHEHEAHIIAQAGRFKAVTIATNMAGRGTDIMLGGNAEHLAMNLVEQNLEDKEDKSQRDDLARKFIEQFRQQVKEEHRKVVELGGLHVLGTERHESRRIDNQLRGRQGRQGDPGSSRFYVSLEDDLMRLFASDRIVGLMERLGMEDGQVLEHPWLTKAIENAQRRVEGHNFEIRKRLLEFDDVMNRQREVIYDMRRFILESPNVKHLILEEIEGVAGDLVAQHVSASSGEEGLDIEGLSVSLKIRFHCDLGEDNDQLKNMPQADAQRIVAARLMALYEAKEKEIGESRLRHIERMVLLQTIDAKWKDHLYSMDQLKEGIGLRSYGQRDPVIEYKKEGFQMFQAMYGSIHQEVAEIIFKVQQAPHPQRVKSVFASLPQRFVHDEVSSLSKSAPRPFQAGGGIPAVAAPGRTAAIPEPVRHAGPKVGRNDPCPCGSGRKYKKCCGSS